MPMVTVEGAAHLVLYANPAFCRLLDKPLEALIGKSFDELLPKKEVCFQLIDRVLQTSRPESYTEQDPGNPRKVLWSYTVWPTLASGEVVNIMIQAAESVKVNENIVAMNEALMLGAVRQHELT